MAFTDYADTSVRAQKAITRTAESWSSNFEKMLEQVPSVGFSADGLRPVVERCFDLAERVFNANRDYVKELTGASLEGRQATVKYVSSITQVLRDQAGVAVAVVRQQAEDLERAERTAAATMQRAAQNGAGTHDAAAHALAKEPYEVMTKSELAELLAERSLPRTGTVDELRERLVEADLQLG